MSSIDYWEVPPLKPVPLRAKLIGKVPMKQIFIAEDGGIWQLQIIKDKPYWFLHGYTLVEKNTMIHIAGAGTVRFKGL